MERWREGLEEGGRQESSSHTVRQTKPVPFLFPFLHLEIKTVPAPYGRNSLLPSRNKSSLYLVDGWPLSCRWLLKGRHV